MEQMKNHEEIERGRDRERERERNTERERMTYRENDIIGAFTPDSKVYLAVQTKNSHCFARTPIQR